MTNYNEMDTRALRKLTDTRATGADRRSREKMIDALVAQDAGLEASPLDERKPMAKALEAEAQRFRDAMEKLPGGVRISVNGETVAEFGIDAAKAIAMEHGDAEPLMAPAREPDATRTGRRSCVVELDDEALAELSRDIVAKYRQIDELEGKRAAESKRLGDQIKGLEQEARAMRHTHERGGDFDDVETTIELYYSEAVAVERVAGPSGRILEVRPLDASERQTSMRLVEPEPGAKVLTMRAEPDGPPDDDAECVIWDGEDCGCEGHEGVAIYTSAEQTSAEASATGRYVGDDWVATPGDWARCLACGTLGRVAQGDDQAEIEWHEPAAARPVPPERPGKPAEVEA